MSELSLCKAIYDYMDKNLVMDLRLLRATFFTMSKSGSFTRCIALLAHVKAVKITEGIVEKI